MNDNETTSTESGSSSSLPSLVDTRTPPKSEPQTHVGVVNSLDPTLFLQNIHNTTFTWSTNDQPGTLLWYTSLQPKNINPLISHLADMYHYWTGGAEYEIKIAGTSFHAGMLTIVELPPQVHPTTLTGTRDYSAYNWHGIDAKNPSLEGFHVRDVRQTAFHFIDNESDKEPHKIGGYIAAYVDMSLNTSSTGTQQVSVQVWSKPSRDFQLLKLKIPRLVPGESKSNVEILINNALDFTNHQTMYPSNLAYAADRLEIQASTYKAHNILLVNHFKPDGTSMCQVNKLTGFDPSTRTMFRVLNTVIDDPYVKFQVQPMLPFRANRYGTEGGVIVARGLSHSTNLKQWGRKDPPDTTGPENSIYFEMYGVNNGKWKDIIGDLKIVEYAGVEGDDFVREPKSTPVPNGESLITFTQAGSSNQYSLQLQHFSELMARGTLKGWLPKGQAAKFILSDKSAGVPVGQVKLYQTGQMTTSASKDVVKWDVEKMAMVFDGFVAETSPFQRTPSHSTNRLLALSFHSSYKRT